MSKSKKLDIDWNQNQQAIFDWVKNGSGHALINAVPGSGRSTTICGIVEQISSKAKIAVLACNHQTAQVLEKQLPSRVTVSTIHRMGQHMLYRRFKTRSLSLNDSKVSDLIKRLLDKIRPDLEHLQLTDCGESEMRPFLQELIHYLQITLTEPNEAGIRWIIQRFSLEAPPEEVLKVLMPWPARLLSKAQRVAEEQHTLCLDDLVWLPHVLKLQPLQKDW